MSKSGLSSRMMEELENAGFKKSDMNQALADAIAKAVVDEIKKADVTIKKAVTSVSGGGGSPAVAGIKQIIEKGAIS
jgi:hypothetical protein